MTKSSRWSQWVISESANPGIPMPWALGGRVRNTAQRHSVPGVIASGAFTSAGLSLR